MNKRRGFLSIGALIAIFFALFSLNANEVSATEHDTASAVSACVDGQPSLEFTVTLGANATVVVLYDGAEHEIMNPVAGTFVVTYPASVGSTPAGVSVLRDAIWVDIIEPTTVQIVACVPDTPPVLIATGVCSDNLNATISGTVSGFTGDHIFVGAIINGDDIAGSTTLTANGPFSFGMSRDVPGFRDLDSVHVFVMASDQAVSNTQLSNLVEFDVDFTKCPPAPATTQPAPTTTAPPATTQPAPTTTAPPTTAPVVPTTPPPTAPVATTTPPAPPTMPLATQLPSTGTSTNLLVIAGLFVIIGGSLLFIRRRSWDNISI